MRLLRSGVCSVFINFVPYAPEQPRGIDSSVAHLDFADAASQVFDPSLVFNFVSDPAFDSDSDPLHDFPSHPAFSPDFPMSPSSDLDEVGCKC
ncbi:hypothetical protein EVAR_37905_1 [Eumeta japonica]|uniref:Uncharacterized protein n=1 Tax=Eumeta variegata TaxID=151549 RepID=A0A4C1XGP2_EUMVA|nr:hypothetical protein EVAR_37905_1 [Eumeta japonica]